MVRPDDRVYSRFTTLLRMQHQAHGFSFLPRQPVGSILTGRHASRLRGRGLDFDELRHYRPGDDIRNLDWKVTNRTGKPHVRSYTEERERPVLLLVDQRLSMFFGSHLRMKSVVAAELAALAAWRVLAVGDRVGAVVFNDEELFEIRPHRSRRNVTHILRRVEGMNHQLHAGSPAAQGARQLNRALQASERLARHDCLVALISDLDGWNAETVKRLKRIARHNDVIAALIYDPLEQQLPDVDHLVVSDGELQLQITPAEGGLGERFAEQFSSSVSFLQGELRKHGVPVIPTDTVAPVDQQLREAIGQGLGSQRSAR